MKTALRLSLAMLVFAGMVLFFVSPVGAAGTPPESSAIVILGDGDFAANSNTYLPRLDNTYIISGNTGIAGTLLTYTDGNPKFVTADGSGNYSISVPSGWSGTVAPIKTWYTFAPVQKSYTAVGTDQVNQDFTATAVTFSPVLSAGETIRVSLASAGAQGTGSSGAPSIASNGRYIAFKSSSNNLVTGDTNGKSDIFVRDRQAGTTIRVSVASDGTQGNGDSFAPVVSADGRFVAFYSYATNLVSGDTNAVVDVFVRDNQLETTTRVSKSLAGYQGNSYSINPAISADGRYIVFTSAATNLVGGDTNTKDDIFLHDILTGTTTRVSVDSSGLQSNGTSSEALISANGRYVAYASSATNLVSGDMNAQSDVFLYDTYTTDTTRISLDSAGAEGNGSSYTPALSAEGRYIVFNSDATNLVSEDTNNRTDIFLRDRQTRITTRVSVDSAGVQGNGRSLHPIISEDGRFIAFNSAATNLVNGDTNGRDDVFMYDRLTAAVVRVSVNTAGNQATGGVSDSPSISADGRYVGFESAATNLVSGDTNAQFDVFAHENNGVPTTSGISDINVNLNAPDTLVDLWAAFADAETLDSTLTYTITNNTNPELFTSVTPPAPGAQYLTLDYLPATLGSAVITVRATDEDGFLAETSFTVSITPLMYSVSGNIGMPGVTLSYTDGTPKTVISQADGSYTFRVSSGWTGTVTPSKTRYTFTPASRDYADVMTDQSGQNYTAIPITYTISGNVGIEGTTLSYTDVTSKTALSLGDGSYVFTVPYNWSGTVVPYKTGYIFTPANKNYANVLVNQLNQDFASQVDTTPIFTQVSTGSASRYTCALTQTGEIKCWGKNDYGQLGDGTTTQRTTPVNVLVSPGGTALTGVSAIVTGSDHACALMATGGVKCWGVNYWGQLGDGTLNQRTSPVDVLVAPGGTPLGGAIALTSSADHTCALITGGSVKCWGRNMRGQLGDGTINNATTPVTVLVTPGGATLTGVSSVTAGGDHTCALMTEGGVKCWGYNFYGQLGDNTTTQRNNPSNVIGLSSGVSSVSAGYNHTCAVLTGGGVKCWGNNANGQLGDGTTSQRNTPVDVLTTPSGAAITGISLVSAGGYSTCALTTAAGGKCWGGNASGNVGDGTILQRNTPVDVLVAPDGAPLGDLSQIIIYGHACALTTSGHIKCWGYNGYGQLGDGTNVDRHNPVDLLFKTAQSIDITTPAPVSAVYGTSFTVVATASSGLEVAYSASGGCTNAGSTFTMTSGATACTINYEQAGNDIYAFAPPVMVTVTAQKAAITVTADAKGKIYGEADPALTYEITSGTLVGTDTFTGMLSRTAGTDAGTYPITKNTLSLNTSKYNLTYVGANLTINQKPISVTAAADSKPYDGTTSSAGLPSITSGSLVGSHTANWLQTFDTQNVGTGKTLTPNGIVNDGNSGNNYAVTFVNNTGEITTKTLTVTAEDQSIALGATLPVAYPFHYAGFVVGENETHLTSAPVCSSPTANNHIVGGYPILCSGGVANNYTFNYIDGVLTVQSDTIAPTVNAFTATTPFNSLNIPITEFTASDNVSVTGYLITAAPTPPGAGEAGWTSMVPATYTVASDGSYILYPWAKDATDNISAIFGSPPTVVVDTTAPETQIDTHPDNPTRNANAIFTFSSVDDTATFECSLNGSDYAACASPKNYTDLVDGLHTFTVRAKDPAGNTDATPASYTWTIRTTVGIRYAKPAVSGTEDCSSWANTCTLQTALAGAVSGDEIWVAAGTHKPTTGADREATFQLKEGVAIYGGFFGTETARDQRDFVANATILSGDLAENDAGFINNTENVYHVVTGATGATLDGFIITAGNANSGSNGPNACGAGMYNASSSPMLANVIFTGNTANYSGAGMQNWNESNPTLMNVSFSGNSSGKGGGMNNENMSNPTLINVTFSGNSAIYGGGMNNENTSNPTLINVTFSGNSAYAGGGMANFDSSNPVLTNVTFSGNSVSNLAEGGGGMYNWNSDPQIRNTIIWGNTSEDEWVPQIFNLFDSMPVVNDSVVQGGYIGGTNIITSDPLLGILENYGGFTKTVPLLTGSSAIDRGNDTVCPAADQRGIARPQGSHCDIGAYEAILTDYTATFNANGGEGTMSPQTASGPTALTLNTYTRAGHAFNSWNAVSDGSGAPYADGEHYSFAADITLYAQWTTLTGPDKIVPANAAVDVSLNPTLSWNQLVGATSYEYCYSSAPGPCTKWNSVGANTSVTLSGLAPGYTYYWQARAVNTYGTAEADNGTWWSFTTINASACTWPAYTEPTSATFGDVPIDVGHWSWVERLANSTITAGCGTGNYCPFSEVVRAQMAIFLLRGRHCGSSYTPPAVGGSTGFGDVPLDATYAPWVKQLAAEGVTAGCGNGNFCPQTVVNRAQMAIFLLRARHGSTYSPPAVGATTGFGDVPLDATYAAWVKQLAAEGVTAGCGNGNFCPLQNVNRAQMATFLVRAFGLP